MIDFWIFPLSTIWGAYQIQGFEKLHQFMEKHYQKINKLLFITFHFDSLHIFQTLCVLFIA